MAETPRDPGRKIQYSFYIPFAGNPADICEEMIDQAVTQALLNSLAEIHPDIRWMRDVTEWGR